MKIRNPRDRRLALGIVFASTLAIALTGGGIAYAEKGGNSDHGEHGNSDHGNSDHGDHGNSDHGDHGNADHGNSDHGNSDHGNSDHGGSDHGNADHGNTDHGGGDHGNADHSGSDHGGGNDKSGGDHGGGNDKSGGDNHGGSNGNSDSHGDNLGKGSDNSGKGSDNSGKGSDNSADNSGKGKAQEKAAAASDETATRASNGGHIELARDRDGREYRAHELVVIGSARDFAALRAGGLFVVGQRPLQADTGSVARIVLPLSVAPETALANVRSTAPAATIDLNGIYRAAGAAPKSVKVVVIKTPGKNGGMLGVIDTGVDPSNKTLTPAIVSRRSFLGSDAFYDLHGTMVSAIAASQGARIVSANVFAPDTGGRPAASADAIAAAVDWLVAQHVPVINLSISGPPNAVVARELRKAQEKGVVVVAAAGNDGPAAPPAYPAAYGQVVAVTATDKAGAIYRYANRGNYIMFAAPGVDVETHRLPPQLARVSGTSYAAPIIAGRLATELKSQDAHAGEAALDTLRTRAKDLGAPGRDPVYGYGWID
jgi:hypothetical protein